MPCSARWRATTRDPHWYLPPVGIDPRFHRKGLGSALLTEALGRCDQEHLPAYAHSGRGASDRGRDEGARGRGERSLRATQLRGYDKGPGVCRRLMTILGSAS
jgi:GNAT superfamily N-acetyltransferase